MQNDSKNVDKVYVKEARIDLKKSEIVLHCCNQEAYKLLRGYLKMQLFVNTEGRIPITYEIKMNEENKLIYLKNDTLYDIIDLLLHAEFISHIQAESLQLELSHNQHSSTK